MKALFLPTGFTDHLTDRPAPPYPCQPLSTPARPPSLSHSCPCLIPPNVLQHDDSAVLAWGKVDGADKYEVQVAEMVSVGVDGWDGGIEWSGLVEDRVCGLGR